MKYKLTDETISFLGINMHRIEALENFGIVKRGDKGGFIESENNLSQSGKAWVSGEAQVSGEARVSGEAQVSGKAQVFGEAQVSGKARVSGEAQVSGKARVSGEAQVSGKAWVSGEAQVSGKARVSGEAQVSGEALIKFDVVQTKFIVLGQFGEHYRYITATQTTVYADCFEGTLTEFKAAVADKYGVDFGSYSDCIKILEGYMISE